jgi:SAM-dependent methyltransferase
MRSPSRRRLLTRNTDADWDYYGNVDPYFGVLTNERFTRDNFDDAARQMFFDSGRRHVDAVIADIRGHLDPSYTPRRAVDFGCGTGRLTLPLARMCDSVVGVDVSPAMLEETTRNAKGAGLNNIEVVQVDDFLSKPGSFDLVHSFIVFQHIPTVRGEEIVVGLVQSLVEGGVGVLQFTYADSSTNPPPLPRRLLTRAYTMPLVYAGRNMLKKEPIRRPPMQMNRYDINRLLRILQEHDCHQVYMRFTETFYFNYPLYGAILFFLKRPRNLSEYE